MPENWEKRGIDRKSPENLENAKITAKYREMKKRQKQPVRGQRRP